MKRLVLDVCDLRRYRLEKWVIYAAEDHGDRRVRLECNLGAEMRVTADGVETWRGGCPETAVKKFEDA